MPDLIDRSKIDTCQRTIEAMVLQIDAVLRPHFDAFMADIATLPKPKFTGEDAPVDLALRLVGMGRALNQWPMHLYKTELHAALWRVASAWGINMTKLTSYSP